MDEATTGLEDNVFVFLQDIDHALLRDCIGSPNGIDTFCHRWRR